MIALFWQDGLPAHYEPPVPAGVVAVEQVHVAQDVLAVALFGADQVSFVTMTSEPVIQSTSVFEVVKVLTAAVDPVVMTTQLEVVQ